MTSYDWCKCNWYKCVAQNCALLCVVSITIFFATQNDVYICNTRDLCVFCVLNGKLLLIVIIGYKK